MVRCATMTALCATCSRNSEGLRILVCAAARRVAADLRPLIFVELCHIGIYVFRKMLEWVLFPAFHGAILCAGVALSARCTVDGNEYCADVHSR